VGSIPTLDTNFIIDKIITMKMNHGEYWTPPEERRADMQKEIDRLESVKESLSKIIDFCPGCESLTVCENHQPVKNKFQKLVIKS
jgi:hypothetical protein